MKRSIKKKKPEYVEEGMISVLSNSPYYFLDTVLVSYEKRKYRLLVIGNSHLYVDKNYNTPRGAKIAFSRIFHNKTWNDEMDEKKGIKQNWSPFYTPKPGWWANVISQATRLPMYGIEENRE
jgi:hypothetical protein